MWEYVKGSEADFAGYDNSTIQIRKRQDDGLVFGSDGIISGTDWLSDIIAERRKVDSLQSRVNDANLGDALKEMFKPTGVVKVDTRVPSKEESDAYNKRFDSVNIDELMAARNTLEEKGYTWCGGSLWKPPLGKVPDYIKQDFDTVQRPAHYNQSGIECIDAIAASMTSAEFQAYLKGNVQKYLWRYQHKNGVEDCRKAQWYLDRLVKELSK